MIWGQRKLRKKFEDHCLEKEFKGKIPGEKIKTGQSEKTGQSQLATSAGSGIDIVNYFQTCLE